MFEVFDIRVNEQFSKDLKEAKELGLNDLARELRAEVLDTTAQYAIAALKSAVPVDTFALRGLNLEDGMFRIRKVNQYSTRVYITDDQHTNRYGRTQSATDLALTLDSGVNEKGYLMFRTQNSAEITPSLRNLSVGGFDTVPKDKSTAGWIAQAQTWMEPKVERFLAKIGD